MAVCAQVVFGLALPSNSRFCNLIGCAIATRVMSPRGRKTLRQLGAKRSMSIAPSRAAEACALVERPRKRKRGSHSTEAFLADEKDSKYFFLFRASAERTSIRKSSAACVLARKCLRHATGWAPGKILVGFADRAGTAKRL